MRFRLELALLVPALLVAVPGALAQTAPPPAGHSEDLYSIDMVPAPDFPGARGRVEMVRAQSPFGVAVTRDGSHVYELRVSAGGLPDPASLDGATTFVAWATTPTLAPMINLGEVGRGRVAAGRVGLDKFLVLITAEPSAGGTERSGRIVLRGTSPSMRMFPHDAPYLTLPASGAGHESHAAAGPGSASAGQAADHPAAHGGDRTGAMRAHPRALPVQGATAPISGWSMPPMHPRVSMPPGMDHLRPSVRPFLPAPAAGDVVDARPGEILRVSDGDTIELVAQPVRRVLNGRTVVTYGYNGQVPGPLLRADQDATIVVRLHNRTPFPSAVHWHGIRVENRFDGAPGVTQPMVPPGGSFTYRVRLPDPGLYWYHPHVREDVKQALGLFGNLRVDAPDPAHLSPVHREAVWMIGDLLVGSDGLVPFGLEGPTHALMGRFGNVLLVNGEPGARLDVDRGEIVRFLLTNVASTRTFNLSFGGARIKLVASDLSRFEREEWVESVVIAPAERYLVEVRFDQPGEIAVENRVRAIDHVYGSFFQEIDTLATIRVSGRLAPPIAGEFDRLREHREVVDEIAPLRAHLHRPPDHELVLGQDTRDLRFPLRQLMQLDSAYFNPVEWSGTMPMMNWAVTSNEVTWTLRDPASGRENMEIDWRFRQGDLVRLRVRNEREVLHGMQHPIHIHGQRFLVLSINGVPGDNLAWKDTFLLPVGWTAELLVEMSNPGDWMMHCHIAEHLESGMMSTFRVDPAENGDPLVGEASPRR